MGFGLQEEEPENKQNDLEIIPEVPENNKKETEESKNEDQGDNKVS